MITNIDIAEQARTWINTKFQHQGRLKKAGLSAGGVDCMGLILGIIKELDIRHHITNNPLHEYDITNYSHTPKTNDLLQGLSTYLIKKEKPEIDIGDIVIFNIKGRPQHLGIVGNYIFGGYSLIHSYAISGKVVEVNFDAFWQESLNSVYCFNKESLV